MPVLFYIDNFLNILCSIFFLRYKLKLGALKRTDHPSKYQLVDSEKAFTHENIVWSRWVKGLVEKNDIGLIRMKESFDSMYIKSWQKILV